MSYTDRFSGSATRYSRPDCFGDEDAYHPRDKVCRKCNFKSSCARVIRAREAAEEDDDDDDDDTPRSYQEYRRMYKDKYKHKGKAAKTKAAVAARKTTLAMPSPEDYEERDDDASDGVGFFGALAINSALSSARAVATEVAFSIDQIPRYPYPDPFKPAARRGRDGKRGDD